MVQVDDFSHENFKSSRVMRWWLSRLSSCFGAKSSRERKLKWLPGLSPTVSVPHCRCWIENLSNLLSLQYKENKGKFAAFNGHLKAKSFSASGGLHPLTRTRGSAPGPRWGFAPRPRTRHKRPLFDPPLFVTFRSPWQVGNVVASSQLRSYSTSSPVNTRMGDRDHVRLLALYFGI